MISKVCLQHIGISPCDILCVKIGETWATKSAPKTHKKKHTKTPNLDDELEGISLTSGVVLGKSFLLAPGLGINL